MKTISHLRAHLFDQLERIAQANSKEEVELEVKKATSVVELSQALMQTATVEAAVIKEVKTLNSAFIPDLMQEVTIKQIEREKKPFEFSKSVFDENKTA